MPVTMEDLLEALKDQAPALKAGSALAGAGSLAMPASGAVGNAAGAAAAKALAQDDSMPSPADTVRDTASLGAKAAALGSLAAPAPAFVGSALGDAASRALTRGTAPVSPDAAVADAVKAHPGAETPLASEYAATVRGLTAIPTAQAYAPPPSPAPAPAPVRGGPRAPATPAAGLDRSMEDMDAQNAIHNVSAPPAPAAAPAPKPAEPQTDAEMEAAQASERQRRLLAILPQFLSGFSSHGEELRKGADKMIGQPVADLLAKRDMARKALADKQTQYEFEQKQAANDLNSPLSKRAQLIMQTRGVPPELAAQLPASSLTEIMSARTAQEATDHAKALITQGTADRASREKVESAHDAKSLEIERMKENAANYRAGLEHNKNTAKPIPPDEREKMQAEIGALGELDTNEADFNKIGPVGGALDKVTPGFLNTAANRFHDSTNVHVPGATAGVTPRARENLPLIEGEKKEYPQPNWSKDRAKAFYDSKRQAIKARLDAHVHELEAAGYSPAEIQSLRQSAGSVGGGAGSRAPTRTDPTTGETRVWNGSAWVKG